ncbi:MAG TPA: TldD/PmbA family protein [candidate division Zixibacteria bacterium]|jgi:TldD protein|nr:TldD/PmbA family protein [candidate division Zixibacteria bacterium]
MEHHIKKALSSCGVDYLEVRIEERSTTSVVYQGRELEQAGTSTSRGGNVRALHRGGWGFASFNTIDQLPEKAAEAERAARLVGRGRSRLAKVKPSRATIRVKLADDPRRAPLKEKEALARRYNQQILGRPGIQSSRVRYEDVFKRQTYANTEGAEIVEERLYCGMGFSAIAKDGANVQTAHDSFGGGAIGFKKLAKLEPLVEQVTGDALDLLKAEKVEAGRYTVVVDPKMSGVFAHEAFGHLSESDHIHENAKLRRMMRLGRRFGPDHLSIVDDATIAGERGSYHYDEEGVPAGRNYLIKNGVLVGRLHSRETAGLMGERPTGSARAISHQYKPIVRMGCTYIEPGKCSFRRMVGEIDRGIYVVSALGGMTELEMFTFSAMKAYRIDRGKIGPMVRDVILSGNVFQTLRNIDAVGDDLELYGGLGGCGKDGQMPLPVSDGGPHIRIRNVIIGGR